MKCAVRFIGIRARLQSKTLHTASPHAATAAAALDAAIAAHRVPLLQGVAARGKLLIVPSVVAVYRRRSVHVDSVMTVNDGAAALASIPFFGEATALLLLRRGKRTGAVVRRLLLVVMRVGAGPSVGSRVGFRGAVVVR